MTVTVRPMTDADDRRYLVEGHPRPWILDVIADFEAGGMEQHWFVGLLDDEPVGFAAVTPVPVAQDGYGLASLNVRPEARRRGVATALLVALEEVCRGQVPGVVLSYLGDQQPARAAAAAWGAEECGRHQENVLDLVALDRADFARRAEVDGVSLAVLLDLDDLDDDAWVALHAFVQARFRETPDAGDGGGELPLSLLRSMLTESWHLVLATDAASGERLGVTFVMPHRGDPHAVNIAFTGVTPDARGRGIATALKCQHALLLADRGVAQIVTQNMEQNAPILAVNRALGFVPGDVVVDVRRELT